MTNTSSAPVTKTTFPTGGKKGEAGGPPTQSTLPALPSARASRTGPAAVGTAGSPAGVRMSAWLRLRLSSESHGLHSGLDSLGFPEVR